MPFKREFGKIMPGLVVQGRPADYRVLNERAVRASAGILLAMAAFSFANAALLKRYIFLESFVVLFFLEFAIRLFVNPDYAPIYALGSRLVSDQMPEWAGALQKRFAWSIGLVMAAAMTVISPVLEIRGLLPFTMCVMCLSFLWAESALGICVGCSIYGFLRRKGYLRSDVTPACAGGVCSIKR